MRDFPGYVVEERIDETFRSVIYRARKVGAPDTVIIKDLHAEYQSPTEMARLRYEYALIRAVDNAGIVKPLDVIEYTGGMALVMEDFHAVALKNQLAGGLPLMRFLDLAIRLAEILGQIHQSGITHRDIKPSNILINETQNTVKLTDFGIAAEVSHSNEEIYNPRVMEGTLAYLSPEQTGRMNCPVDYRCDLYSLGITLYEMLTGKVPFMSQDPMEIIHGHIAKPPLSPRLLRPTVPAMIADIVMKLLSKAPEERYQNSFGLLYDLKECLAQLKHTSRIEAFSLGRYDIALRFTIPQALVGRDKEVAVLTEAFERICGGGREAILITGGPGIGKSALVKELHKTITARHGYFVSGKYEQFRRHIPYSAVIQAFQALSSQLLAESRERLAFWKQRLNNVLGPNGRIITDTVPEFVHIIGEQPLLPELNPEEAQNRFNLVCRNFVRVFARSEHPLVVFLDDLQWADDASLSLLYTIATDRGLENILLIGAFRDNESAAPDPLLLAKDAIIQEGTQVTTLKLEPLPATRVRQIVANLLRRDDEASSQLAALVFDKTGGNPFFVNQFLKTLYEQGRLILDADHGWQWDIDAIRGMQVTDNVVEILSAKIDGLDPAVRHLIQVCACIGNRFDIETISTVMKLSLDAVVPSLDILVQEGLINVCHDLYRFQHDRILEAAYSLIPVPERQRLHAQIGRRLLETSSPEQLLGARIFSIADQLNQARGLITSQAERVAMVDINLKAGLKAKETLAYTAAADYLKNAADFLPESAWSEQYELTFRVYRERMECEYLIRDFDAAKALFSAVVTHARNTFDKARAYHDLVVLYTHIGNLKEAIALGLEGLGMLGMHLPQHPSKIGVLKEIMILRTRLRKIGVEHVMDLPLMTNQEMKARAMLYGAIGTPAYYVDPNLFAVVVLKGINMDLEYGLTHTSAFGFMAIATILGANLGAYDKAYSIAEMALALNEKLDEKRFAGKVNFVFAYLILHWTRPLKDSLEYYRRAYTYGLETGDLIYCGLCLNAMHMTRIALGENAAVIMADHLLHRDFITEIKDPFALNQYEEIIHLCRYLTGQTGDKAGAAEKTAYLFEERLAAARREGNLLEVFFVLLLQEQIAYLDTRYEDAYRVGFELDTLLDVPTGSFQLPEHIFYRCLSLLAVYREQGAVQQCRIRSILKRHMRRLKRWSKSAPANYLPKYLLVEAEKAAVSGRFQEAVRSFHHAMQAAREHGYVNIEALAAERGGLFHLGQGLEEIAHGYLKQAHQAYQRWGAMVKTRQLESVFPFLSASELKPHSAADGHTPLGEKGLAATSSVLDLTTVMQSSQAISGEIVLDRLLQKIMKIAVTNAGAQRGFFLLDTDGSLTIEASEEGGEDSRFLQAEPLESSESLARSVVNYVHHSGETLLLENAGDASAFKTDPYIQQHRCKSILCMPILSKGKLTGILYMENNLTAGAFTPERLELLRVISAQAAISLENARLFELATTDGLTKLFVHRYFHLLLDQEIQKFERYKRPFSLIMMDIDDFKRCNDTYGHQFGDEVLRGIARTIRRTVRAVDTAARYGGEEFVLILPETDADNAMAVAEKIRLGIAQMEILHDTDRLHTTVSLGVASFPFHATDKEGLIGCADKALYTAKRTGKNRVCLGENT